MRSQRTAGGGCKQRSTHDQSQCSKQGLATECGEVKHRWLLPFTSPIGVYTAALSGFSMIVPISIQLLFLILMHRYTIQSSPFSDTTSSHLFIQISSQLIVIISEHIQTHVSLFRRNVSRGAAVLETSLNVYFFGLVVWGRTHTHRTPWPRDGCRPGCCETPPRAFAHVCGREQIGLRTV